MKAQMKINPLKSLKNSKESEKRVAKNPMPVLNVAKLLESNVIFVAISEWFMKGKRIKELGNVLFAMKVLQKAEP